MQTLTNNYSTAIKNRPSLLRQIMDVVDEMDEGGKKLLLIKLTKEELMQEFKELDDKIARSEWIMPEEEIDALAAKTRQEMYEERLRS